MNVEQRMARLERENLVHRGLWGAAVVIGIAFLVWRHAGPTPELIQAQTFEVVNPWGQVVLRAAATFSGAELIVYAAHVGANEGGIRAQLVSLRQAGYLTLRGGDNAFLAMVTADDGASLQLENKKGQTWYAPR